MLLEFLTTAALSLLAGQADDPAPDGRDITIGGFDPALRHVAAAREAYALGELGSAHDHLRLALGEAPGEVEIRLLLGRVLNDLGHGADALGVIEPALEAAPGSAWLLVEHGRAQETLGEDGAAERSYRASLEAYPRCGAARLRLAELLLRTGRPAEATEALAPLFEQAPDEPAVVVLRARLLESEGRSEEAVTLLGARLEDDPEDVSSRLALSHLLLSLGRTPEAWVVVEPLLDGERDPERLVFLAKVARRDDRVLEALAAIGLALASDPGHPGALRELYEIVERGEGLRLRLAERRTDASPDDSHAWQELLELHIEESRFEAFFEVLGRVPEGLRSGRGLRLLEARALRRTGQVDRAHALLTELSAEDATEAGDAGRRAAYELGLLEYARGNVEAAADAFGRGAAGRWAADAHFNRGVCLERLGRYREAAAEHEAATAARAGFRDAWHQLGNLFRFRLGEADRAREAYARYLEYGGDDPEVRRWVEDTE